MFKNEIPLIPHQDPTPIAPIFIVNLERSQDRREKITSRLKEIGASFELFPAVDGAKLSEDELAIYDEKLVFEKIARPLSRSEIGCYLSHKRLWQRIVDNNLPWAAVLEDDVNIHDDLGKVLSSVSQIPLEWDFVRLAGICETPFLELYALGDSFKLAVLLQGASGTQGYCISHAGAKKLLEHASVIQGTVDDHLIDNCWKTGLKILAVQPYPISEDKKFISFIEEDRKKLLAEGRAKPTKLTFKNWLIRRRYKLARSIRRRIYYLFHLLVWLSYRKKADRVRPVIDRDGVSNQQI